MSKRRKLLTLTIIFMLLLGLSLSVQSEGEDEINEKFYLRQNACIEKYNIMLNEMDGDTYGIYGGAYIDDEQNLVVQLLDVKENTLNKITSIIGNKNVKIELCYYSYSELVATVDLVVKIMENMSKQGIFIDAVHENVYNNNIEVFVRDLDREKQLLIQAAIDKEFLVFINSEGAEEPCAYIKGGYEIVSTDNNASSTLSFCAYYGSTAGYVIAGHAGDSVGEEFKYGSSIIGEVDDTAYYDYTTADAAFVDANSNGTLTDDVVIGDVCGTITYSLPVGTTISFYGQATGAIRSGTITSTNHSYVSGSSSYHITDCYSTSFSPVGGDSGAPVLLYEYSGHYSIVGIVNTSAGSCSKYSNIASELGISAKTN